MSKKESEILIFKMADTIEYAVGGDFKKTATLELKPPSMNEFDEATEFSQLVIGAFMEVSIRMAEMVDTGKSDPNKKPTANEIKMCLMSAKNTKFTTIEKAFRPLLEKVGTYDGKETIVTESLKKYINIDDYTNLIVEYAAKNFLASF